MNDGLRRTAYAYVRVSTKEQAQGLSLESQEIAIRKYAKENNIDILGVYSDPGYSAKDARRPDLQRMIGDIHKNKGKINHVIVYDLSRISRNMESYCSEIGIFIARDGTTLRSTKERIDETPLGRLLLNISLSIYQFDNDTKAQTVRDNMRLHAEQGWWMSQPPLGLRLKHVLIEGTITVEGKRKYHNTLEIDDTDNTAEIIQFLLNRFSEGDIGEANLLRIAHKMGLKSKKGQLISFMTLDGILRQPAYAGYNASKRMLGGKMVKLAGFDGVISLDVFKKNQKILTGNIRELTPSDDELYPLKHTLICDICGKPIRASAPTDGGGKKSPRYHCCEKGHGSISIKEMHRLYVDFLDTLMPTDETIKLFKATLRRTAAKKLNDTNAELAECRNELSDIDTKLNEAVDALLEGKISQEEKDRYTGSQLARRSETERRIMELEKIQQVNESTIDYVCSFITKPAKLWMDASLESRQAFQTTMFPNGLHFNIGERKFGTEDLSPLYSVIGNKNEPETGSDSGMVHLILTHWNAIIWDIRRIRSATSIIPLLYRSPCNNRTIVKDSFGPEYPGTFTANS
jgi:site-specific DNA recombinase